MNYRTAILIAIFSLSLVGCGGPESPQERGYVHLQLGHWQESIEAYNEALAIDPTDAESWTGRGRAHYSLGHVDAAMSDYNKAIEVAPEYSEAYYLRAVIYEARGEMELSRRDRMAARELDPATKLAKLGEFWTSPSARLPSAGAESSPGAVKRDAAEVNAAAISSDRSAAASRGGDAVFEDEIEIADAPAVKHYPKSSPAKNLTLEQRIEQRTAELDSNRLATSATSRMDETASQLGAPSDVRGGVAPSSYDAHVRRSEGIVESKRRDVGVPERDRTVPTGANRRGTTVDSDPAKSRPPRAARNRNGGLAISPFDLNPFAPTSRASASPTMGPAGPPSVSPFSTPAPTNRAQPPSPLVIGPAAAPSQSPFGRRPTTTVAPTGSAPVIGPSGPPSQSPFARPRTATQGPAASAAMIGPAGPPQVSPFARRQAAPLQLFQPVSPK
jgi:hypothetical protein